MTKRYEYFDSRGNMIGYEFYNNMTRQWEYYEAKSQNSYQEPAKVDISSLGNAASILQGRYDNNVQLVQNTINAIVDQINSLDISTKRRDLIIQTFSTHVRKNLNGKSANYSSANETRSIINWLYDTANQIIKNTESMDNSPSTNKSLSGFFGREYNVFKIKQFGENAKPEEKIVNGSYILLSENEIRFKKADGSLVFRNLINKRYNSYKKGFEFDSDWGAVFIDEDLSYVEFFPTNQAKGDNYTYYISR